MTAVVPVALIAYRRPDLLARALASLRANAVPLVYAFSDGPRNAEAANDVARSRELLRAVDWGHVEIIAHERNVGVSANVLGSVSRVLEAHESVFVVEEDLEFVPGTYAWVSAALMRYRDDPRVMGVAAWNHPRVTPPDVTTDPYFAGRTTSLLWATWRRAWTGMMDTDCAALVARCRARGIDAAAYGDDNVTAAEHEHEYGMWDHRFNLHVLAARGLFLWPARSMGAHRGYDARATNSPHGEGWEDAPSPAPAPDAVRWPEVCEHPSAAALWRKAVNAPPPPSLAVRAMRKLRRALGG